MAKRPLMQNGIGVMRCCCESELDLDTGNFHSPLQWVFALRVGGIPVNLI